MERLIWLNGQLLPASAAKVSVYDHGVLYGDGIFEGLRQYHGRVFKIEAHLRRFCDSARAIRLPLVYTAAEISAAIDQTLAANQMNEGYVRLVATRGRNDLGISPAGATESGVFIIAETMRMYPAEMYRDGMAIITASTVRTAPNAVSPRIKSLNYLNNILAKFEALDAGVPEAVMLNHLGNVAECTADNIFIVRRGVLATPGEDAGILAGITRGVVLELARGAGLPVVETNLTRFDLYVADECFLTGTGAEIIPVTSIDQRAIGTGKPGPVTGQLIEAFHREVRQQG